MQNCLKYIVQSGPIKSLIITAS